MSGNEIITIQCGNFSNFIGSHWWNFHESNCYSSFATKGIFNYDILFNQGENLKKEVTFTPRLMIIDAKGSLGYLSQFGHQLYDTTPGLGESGDVSNPLTSSVDEKCWDGKVEVVDQSDAFCKRKKNDFLRALDGEIDSTQSSVYENGLEGNHIEGAECLERRNRVSVENAETFNFREQAFDLNNQIHTWSDYMKTLLHPRTITVVNEYEMKCDERGFRTDFGSFPVGNDLFKRYLDEVESNCYYQMEKCDNMQGFNVFSDAYDGVLSSISSEFLSFLSDEFPKKPILTFPCCELLNNSQVEKLFGELSVNTVLAISSFLNSSSTVTPLSLADDWFSWQPQPSWINLHRDWFTTTSGFFGNKYEQSALLALAYHSSLAPLYCAENESETEPQFMPLYSFAQLMTPSQRKVLSMSSNFGHFSSSKEVGPLFGCCAPSTATTKRPLAFMTCLWNSKNGGTDARNDISNTIIGTRDRLWTEGLLRHPIYSYRFDIREGVLLEPPFPRLFSKQPPKTNLPIFSAVSNCEVSASLLEQLLLKTTDRRSDLKMNRRLVSACSKVNVEPDYVTEALETLHAQLGQYRDECN